MCTYLGTFHGCKVPPPRGSTTPEAEAHFPILAFPCPMSMFHVNQCPCQFPCQCSGQGFPFSSALVILAGRCRYDIYCPTLSLPCVLSQPSFPHKSFLPFQTSNSCLQSFIYRHQDTVVSKSYVLHPIHTLQPCSSSTPSTKHLILPHLPRDSTTVVSPHQQHQTHLLCRRKIEAED